MAFRHKTDLIGIFSSHPVAANLLMAMMLLFGIWSVSKLNTQFFPNFDIDFATISVVWTGASAEDVERLITTPIEQELRDLDGVKELTSSSAEGVASIAIEFDEDTDITEAVDDVKQRIDQVSNLPSSAETPEVTRILNYEPIARLLVTGSNLRELRTLAHRFERELLDRGIAKVNITGLPEEEIAIQVPSARMRELGLSLDEIGRRVASFSRDLPVGVIGRSDAARQLRFTDQRRDELSFLDVPVVVDESGQRVTLDDIAVVEQRARNGQVTVGYRGKPAVELRLFRSESGDSLDSARILDEWQGATEAGLPPGIDLVVYDQQWELIKQRIGLLLKNGGTGLLLVVLILFWFLNARVAWWVAVGIPISFMATLGILFAIGGSINMISLFALIMALGIIVDDAIVVGEDAMAHYQMGEGPLQAAEGGARRMLAPVMSSSLTTIAAFMPLLIISGIIGRILREIPTVIICVIIASLIESFLVLPGHLRHSLAKVGHYRPKGLRKKLDNGFNWFRDKIFRPVVTKAIDYRWTCIAISLASVMVTAGMFMGGRMMFTFFPSAEGKTIFANIDFVAGTPAGDVKDYLTHMEQAVWETEQDFGVEVLAAVVSRHGVSETDDQSGTRRGDQFGSVLVELTEPDDRDVRNRDFIQAWRKKLRQEPGIENLSVSERRAGPPGQDIDIRITGSNIDAVKAAALELKQIVSAVEGVSGLEDNMPFGRQQLVLSLTPTGESVGLTVDQIGQQLRAAYDGYLVQTIPDGDDDVEVRVLLPDFERNSLGRFEDLDIALPNGDTVPISNVVDITHQRGFDSIRHADGKLAVTVTGDVDPAVANSNVIVENLNAATLPELSSKHGVNFSFEGRQADQQETLTDMRNGALVALIMIYLVLAWVFGSYGWPLVVMAIIPFGLVGAVWGHALMGLNLTILSLFGFFGLAGIVVNDSIILVVFYKSLRQKGMAVKQAVIEAACQRLRAVLLTSLTTIAGLTPLLFETSLQAQFLIPMATSIAFGLAFATLLVLILVPCLLYIHENVAAWTGWGRNIQVEEFQSTT